MYSTSDNVHSVNWQFCLHGERDGAQCLACMASALRDALQRIAALERSISQLTQQDTEG